MLYGTVHNLFLELLQDIHIDQISYNLTYEKYIFIDKYINKLSL